MRSRADEKRVTRDVELSAVRDLLDRPPRGTVAFVEQDAVEIVPVRPRCSAESYSFGVPTGAAPDLEGREVVLVIDDGQYWFELRGVSVRGVARQIEGPAGAGGLRWYALEPRRMLAWDYDSLRET
jgi:hypothetical protein